MVSWSQSLYLLADDDQQLTQGQASIKCGPWDVYLHLRFEGLRQNFTEKLWETHGEFSKTSWRQELQHVRCDPWVSHGIRNQNLPWSQGTAFLCILFGDFFLTGYSFTCCPICQLLETLDLHGDCFTYMQSSIIPFQTWHPSHRTIPLGCRTPRGKRPRWIPRTWYLKTNATSDQWVISSGTLL